MRIINCPLCGPRDHAEFTYIGDATKNRPENGDSSNDHAWYDFVYLRDNPKGLHEELWQHSFGCRCFVKVLRNTLTHEIIATGMPKDNLILKEKGLELSV